MVHECFGPLLVSAHTIDIGQFPSSVDLPPNMNSPISKTHVADDLYSQAIDGLTLWQSFLLTLWMLVIFFHKLLTSIATFLGRKIFQITATLGWRNPTSPSKSNDCLTFTTTLIVNHEHPQVNLDINLLPPLLNQIVRSLSFHCLLLCYGNFDKSTRVDTPLLQTHSSGNHST
jgi:hypothetical protein